MSVFVGTRTTQAAPIGNNFIGFGVDGGTTNLGVDGSVTPVVYTYPADTTQDFRVQGIRFACIDNGIAAAEKFLALNSALTNGLLVELKSENQVFTFPAIKQTSHFKDRFTFNGGLYDLLVGSGQDSLTATYLAPGDGITIRKQGTYGTDDYIRCTVRDNLTQVTQIEFLIFGAFV